MPQADLTTAWAELLARDVQPGVSIAGEADPVRAALSCAATSPDACARAVWEMLALLDRELPEAPHYALAYQAIRLAENNEAVPKEARLALGAELAERAGKLREHLGVRGERVVVRVGGMSEAEVATGNVSRLAREGVTTPRVKLAALRAMNEADDDGVLRLDTRLAEYLKGIGSTGKALAMAYLKRVRERLQAAAQQTTIEGAEDPALHWRGWIDLAVPDTWSPALGFWAWALWIDVVKPRLEAQRAKPPALAYGVLEPLLAAHTPGNKYANGLVVDADGRQLPFQWEAIKPTSIPSMPAETLARLSKEGVELIWHVNGYRTWLWEVSEGHRRTEIGERNPGRIRVRGGWKALAKDVGAGETRRAWEEVRKVILAQAHLRFQWPDGSYGNMITYRYRPARGRAQSELILTLSDVLLPDYVFQLKRGQRRDRRLVPITTPPPLVGRRNEHGAQLALWIWLVTELREGARELVTDGGVLIKPDRMAELAAWARLPEPMVPRVLDRWTQDGDDAPAPLARVEKDRYTLGPAHRDAERFLRLAGEREIQGRRDGHRSAQKRAQRHQKSRKRRK